MKKTAMLFILLAGCLAEAEEVTEKVNPILIPSWRTAECTRQCNPDICDGLSLCPGAEWDDCVNDCQKTWFKPGMVSDYYCPEGPAAYGADAGPKVPSCGCTPANSDACIPCQE